MNVTPLQKKTAQAIVNIFETGSLHGKYDAVAVIPGDTGHLSYGRSQASLGSGNLYKMLAAYVAVEEALCGALLRPWLAHVQAKDISLDENPDFKHLLQQAGADPIMHKVQDDFFDQTYWNRVGPLCDTRKIVSALGAAVIYDSLIQGSLLTVAAPMPLGFQSNAWVAEYVEARRKWMIEKGGVVARTVYRMDAFDALINSSNWDLSLPIIVRGIAISIDNLG